MKSFRYMVNQHPSHPTVCFSVPTGNIMSNNLASVNLVNVPMAPRRMPPFFTYWQIHTLPVLTNPSRVCSLLSVLCLITKFLVMMLPMLMPIHQVISLHQLLFLLMINILSSMKLDIKRNLIAVLFYLFSKLSKVTQNQDVFGKKISILFSFLQNLVFKLPPIADAFTV